MQQKVLFLASRSYARQALLKVSRIPFVVVDQDADETGATGSLEDQVREIAHRKLMAAQLPVAHADNVAFVLSADTLVAGSDGVIMGKPRDHAAARDMLRSKSQAPVRVATGFCCARYRAVDGLWQQEKLLCDVVVGEVQYAFTEATIDYYLRECPEVTTAAGGLMVEGFGAQFIRSISGSYTAIVGLPLAEVREALEKLGFFAQ